MTKDKNEFIIVSKSGVKKSVYDFLVKAFDLYISVNCATTNALAKLFKQDWLKSTSLALLINIVILSFIEKLFDGFIGKIALILLVLNVVSLLINCALAANQK